MKSLLSASVKLWNDRRGSALVEFAYALPILFIIVVGILEVGRAIHYHQALTEGVRAGVRYLTRVGDPCSSGSRQGAVGLVVTRSIGWNNPPLFADWPEDYASSTSDPEFQVEFADCDPGTGQLTGPTVSMTAEFTYSDSLGVLDWIGHEGGMPMQAGHEEVWIGL
ncbi:MAG: pilus assembly protein [Rhodospirillales bacterium]|nr:pilus assembly protein [Rhodospirillales bacterium]